MEGFLHTPIDAGAIGFLVFAELPDGWTWAGSGPIVVSAVYIVVREGRLAREGRPDVTAERRA